MDEHIGVVSGMWSQVDTGVNPLIATVQGSGYKLFVKWRQFPGGPASVQLALWRQYQGARLERYLHYGAVIQMPSFTHRPSV